MVLVATLSFEDARKCVLDQVTRTLPVRPVEEIALLESEGRVLARAITADRDFPAVSRSVRDGFAVRAADLPGSFSIVGEVRAGQAGSREVGPREAVEIMTGAPVPLGADAVVMIEHVTVQNGSFRTDRVLKPGENISPRGSEAEQGTTLLLPGQRISFAAVGLLAALGRVTVPVFRKPQVAILATGDEIVNLSQTPLPHQIRNSNTYSLATQVKRAGGSPVLLPIARDDYASTLQWLEMGLNSDLLLISGGVSAGKYDIVERVLADMGAEFFFDRVLIQPGQPLVFGSAQGKFFFGLPGNPVSTMVTFELFGRAALHLLSGQADALLPLPTMKLACDFRQKPGLTRFLPAHFDEGQQITPVPWHGSGDLAAVARANCFLVTEPERETWAAGEPIRVLLI